MTNDRTNKPRARRSSSPSRQLANLVSEDDNMNIDDPEITTSSRSSILRDTATQSGSEDPENRKDTKSPGTSPDKDIKDEAQPISASLVATDDGPRAESDREMPNSQANLSPESRPKSSEIHEPRPDIPALGEESMDHKGKHSLKSLNLYGKSSDSDKGMYPPSTRSGSPVDEDLMTWEPARPASPPEYDIGSLSLAPDDSDEEEHRDTNKEKDGGIDACHPGEEWEKDHVFISMLALPQQPDQRPGNMHYMIPSVGFIQHDYSQAMVAEPRAVCYKPPMPASAHLVHPGQSSNNVPAGTSEPSLRDLLPPGFIPQRAINVSQWAFLELSQFVRPEDLITCESTDDYRTLWYCSEDWMHPSYRWPGPETAYCVQCWKPSLRTYIPPMKGPGRTLGPVFGEEHPIDIEKFNVYLGPRISDGERAYLVRAMEKRSDFTLTKNRESREATLFQLFCEQLKRNGGLPLQLGSKPLPHQGNYPLLGPNGPFGCLEIFGPLHDIMEDYDRKWQEAKASMPFHPEPDERRIIAQKAARAALLAMLL